jgi:hypothetical protein
MYRGFGEDKCITYIKYWITDIDLSKGKSRICRKSVIIHAWQLLRLREWHTELHEMQAADSKRQQSAGTTAINGHRLL